MRTLRVMMVLSAMTMMLAMSADADAGNFRRYPAAACFADPDPVWDLYVPNPLDGVEGDSQAGGVANKGWYRQYLACPIIDDDRYDRANNPVQFVDLHFWDGSLAEGTSATACVAYFHGWGGECSPPGASSAASYRGWAKVQLVGVNIGVLNARPFDFAYILAEIPRENGGWHSSLQGYHVQYHH